MVERLALMVTNPVIQVQILVGLPRSGTRFYRGSRLWAGKKKVTTVSHGDETDLYILLLLWALFSLLWLLHSKNGCITDLFNYTYNRFLSAKMAAAFFDEPIKLSSLFC